MARLFATPLLVTALLAASLYYPAEVSREIPILMYHHILDVPPEEVPNNATISYQTFRTHIETLYHAGFTAIRFDELIAFVDEGRDLPSRPVIITFDDGYRSNLELAAPVLAEYGMQATIHVVGIARGRDTHWVSGEPITPHFSWDEARPWVQSGVIDIQHHSYNMHHARAHEPEENFRHGVLQREGENDQDYRAAFIEDWIALVEIMQSEIGTIPAVFAYPFGRYTEATEAMLRELGVRVTLTTRFGVNTVRRGDSESLRLLNRINMSEANGPERVIEETQTIGSTKLWLAS